MRIVNARIFRAEQRRFVLGELRIEGDRIVPSDGGERTAHEPVWDAGGRRVTAGLVDVHTHGRAGFDFTDADEASLSEVMASFAKRGVTGVMPTLASAPLEEMYRMTQVLHRHRPRGDEADICGIHWEGRYLNPKRRGAHAISMLAPLSARELTDERLRDLRAFHLTAAFELDTDGSFARAARALGATLALGHTDADYETARLAETRGVSAYTHLFNAMPPLHHREGGAVAAALTGDAYKELICDGIHVAPEMIRLVYRAGGADRMVLISDSMSATGCPDGAYSIAGNAAYVKDGIARTADGALAGSTLTLDDAVRNVMRMCEIPLEEAILMATANPAREVGVYDRIGSLDAGKQADLLVLRDGEDFEIDRVMLRGSFLPDGEARV